MYDWEKPLVSSAQDALDYKTAPAKTIQPIQGETLRKSYDACRNMTAAHSRSFSLASRLLPADKRRSIHALYAICRKTDDMVDESVGVSMENLQEWQDTCLGEDSGGQEGILPAWMDTRLKYRIPDGFVRHLFSGVMMDLTRKRYDTFEDLAHYCYGVASTVGLMYISIVGFQSDQALPYAIRMGVALQLTNILRDIAEDWRMGRLYLPREELQQFGLDESDIQKGVVTDRWREFMRFQVDRARRLYRESIPGIHMVHRDGQLALYAASQFYQGILWDIERHDYDVFNRRAYLSGMEKMRRIPVLWWRTQNQRFV